MSYLLDANVFMSANNLHYGLDFCPAFWEWLAHKGHTGSVFSIDKVADEIEAGQDGLSTWAKTEGEVLFRRTPPALAEQFTQVSSWVMAQQYTRAVEVNIAIMRTFVQLRRLMDSNRDLRMRIEAMETRYDEQFSQVFDAIKQLIADDKTRKTKPPIGFL